MDGHWDADGTAMIAVIQAADGRAVPVKSFPWWLVRMASPVVPLFREMAEMRYLWRTALRMHNARLVSVLGAEPHTPLEEAVRTTLAGLDIPPSSQAEVLKGNAKQRKKWFKIKHLGGNMPK